MTDLLPRNATTQERAMANTVARISSVQTPLRSLWSPQDCPADFLPWLAWGLSLDIWDASWTDAQKREAIAASVEVHRRKGTIGALKRALQAIGSRSMSPNMAGLLQTSTPRSPRLDKSRWQRKTRGPIWPALTQLFGLACRLSF